MIDQVPERHGEIIWISGPPERTQAACEAYVRASRSVLST